MYRYQAEPRDDIKVPNAVMCWEFMSVTKTDTIVVNIGPSWFNARTEAMLAIGCGPSQVSYRRLW